jgi:hypothetical protein
LLNVLQSASDERIGLAAKRYFHSRGMSSATGDDDVLGYSTKRLLTEESKAPGQSSSAVAWIGRPPRPGSWNRAQLHAGVTDQRRFQGMFVVNAAFNHERRGELEARLRELCS